MKKGLFRKLKGILASAAAVAMTVGMMGASAVPVMAADNAVNVADHTFEAYQILAGTQASDGGALAVTGWGTGINGGAFLTALKDDTTFGSGSENKFYLATDAKGVADAISGNSSFFGQDSENLRKVAQIAYQNKTSVTTDITKKTSTESTQYTISTPGYYLVVDNTNVAGKQDVKNLSVLSVSSTATIQAKSSYPTLEKTIVEGDKDVKANEASIGDKITYKLTSSVPALSGYDYYYFTITDTISKGLTFANNADTDNMLVKIGDNVLTRGKDYTVSVNDYNSTKTDDAYAGGNVITINFVDFLKYCKDNNIAQGVSIIVTYNAQLNTDAKIYGDGNPNEAKLTYSNNPDYKHNGTPSETPDSNEPVGETPESQVETYTTAVEIHKEDNSGHVLTGAEFTLTGNGVNIVITTGDVYVEDPEGTYYLLNDGTYTDEAPTGDTGHDKNYSDTTKKYSKETSANITKSSEGRNVKAFVNDQGVVKFTGLGAGTYKIEETVVPAGFNKYKDVNFSISFDNAETNKFSISSTDAEFTFNNTDKAFNTTIQNVPGGVLPSTGGIGTRIFYTVGGVVVVAAAVLLVIRKKRNA